MPESVVLLVGHCGPDSFMLKSALRSMLPEASVELVNSQADLESRLDNADLLLVNRVLDGNFSSDSGVELIARYADRGPRLMLISNYPEAQAEAEKAGAVPGFGKSELRSDQTRQRLISAVAAE